MLPRSVLIANRRCQQIGVEQLAGELAEVSAGGCEVDRRETTAAAAQKVVARDQGRWHLVQVSATGRMVERGVTGLILDEHG